LPKRHPNRARALLGLGEILIARGDPAAAAPLLREALDVFRAALSPGHPNIAAAEHALAAAER
jgi:hypothetical protein